MAEKLWSAWEWFGARDGAYAGVQVARPTDFNELRCADRVRAVEAVAGQTGTIANEPQLAADLRGRTEYWLGRLEADRQHFAPMGMVPAWMRWLTILGTLAGLAAFAAALAMEAAKPVQIAAVFVLLSLPTLMLYPMWVGGRRMSRRMAARFKSRACIECGRSLVGDGAAIEPERLQRIWVGPARCPASGCPWPMVPPPTPREG